MMPRTPPVGVPLPLPPLEQTGPTRVRRVKRDTYDLFVELGWRLVALYLGMLGFALGFALAGFEGTAQVIVGGTFGSLIPPTRGRR